MTRGRIPVEALRVAEPIAQKRGLVQHYMRKRGSVCNFTIMSPGIVAHVALRCVRRLCCTVEEISRDCAAEIAALRIIASSKEISRELWLSSPRYALRFFRVLDNGLIELGRDGAPLTAANPTPASAAQAGGVPSDKPGEISTGKTGDAPSADDEKNPAMKSEEDLTGKPGDFTGKNDKNPAGESGENFPGKSGEAVAESTEEKPGRRTAGKSGKNSPGKSGEAPAGDDEKNPG
jgi:hypothetical protein